MEKKRRSEVTALQDDFRENILYSYSFVARLIRAGDPAKRYYSILKNEMLSYHGVKSRISWRYDTYNLGRLQLLRMAISGQSLLLYLALDPASYPYAVYHQVDKGAVRAYQKVPMRISVKSELGLRRAIGLIGEMMTISGIERGESKPIDYADWYRYLDTDTLIEKQLVKRLDEGDDK